MLCTFCFNLQTPEAETQVVSIVTISDINDLARNLKIVIYNAGEKANVYVGKNRKNLKLYCIRSFMHIIYHVMVFLKPVDKDPR